MDTYVADVPNVTAGAYDKNNVLITASASASATSNISYGRAHGVAYNLALQSASDLAQSLVNKQNIHTEDENNTKLRIGFFSSSSMLLSPRHYRQLNKIFKSLDVSKFAVVYGGGQKGMMGQVGQLAVNNNLSLYAYDSVQFGASQYSEAQVVEFNSLVPRENVLINNTDVTVILPGGYGTLMELFWASTLNNIGERQKKVIIWNVNGYYTGLITFLLSDKFQQNPKRTLEYNKIVVCNTYTDVLLNLKN
jgi:uncharacterized protein (TIGR00730 family)